MDTSLSETLKLAIQLLEIESVTPNDNGCQPIIANYLTKLGFSVTTFQFNSVSNMWARLGTSQPVLCFSGHTDVVPPGDLSRWRNPPFVPTIADGELTARGAADMKSSIAAMMTACSRFLHSFPKFEGSIAFLITSDEEGPAQDGTQAALRELQKLNEIPNWVLVGEASSTNSLADLIRVGRRGSLSCTLTMNGKQGHVAYPHLANNPIHAACQPLHLISQHVWDQGSSLFPPTSLQISNITSGTGADNVIPGSLEAKFNLRYCPESSPETIKQVIEDILKTQSCEYNLDWYHGGKPFLTSPDSVFVSRVSKIIEKELGYYPQHSTSGGTSDGRFFAEYGCEVLELGPKNATIHQVNECINVKELDQLSALYEKILEGLLKNL